MIQVGVLGATGMVGMHYISLLMKHDEMELCFATSSRLGDFATYVAHQWEPHLGEIPDLTLFDHEALEEALRKEVKIVFSTLSSEKAKRIELLYAKAGIAVISSSSAFRMDPLVPVVIPEINPNHLKILDQQQAKFGTNAPIIAKPNCTLQTFLIPLYPLHKNYGVKKCVVSTMQSMSGAGFNGLSSLSIHDNVMTHIPGEEEKIYEEVPKILGECSTSGIVPTAFPMSIRCHRVPVRYGHTASVYVEFEKPIQNLDDFFDSFEIFNASNLYQDALYIQRENSPTPFLDCYRGEGMSVSAGRFTFQDQYTLQFTSVAHNVIRGAAGGGVRIAETYLGAFAFNDS